MNIPSKVSISAVQLGFLTSSPGVCLLVSGSGRVVVSHVSVLKGLS